MNVLAPEGFISILSPDVSVAIHIHDRNMPINADVRAKHNTIHQNDFDMASRG